MLNDTLGKDGTRLCGVARTYEQDGDVMVETIDTVCSAGEAQGSDRKCTFTWGALEAITGEMYLGSQTDSVLRGGKTDTFVFSPL